MLSQPVWWSVVGAVAFLAVLVFVIIFTRDKGSPTSKTHKQKRKKSKKRSRSPPRNTGHVLKRRPLNVFKCCQECRHKITVVDMHNLCLACLGRSHAKLNCRQCMAFTWKAFRGRFVWQFLWISVTRDEKSKNPGPLSARMSSRVLADNTIHLEGKEQYLGLIAEAAAYYKKANAQASAPLDTSSSLSALEESIFSSSDGEGGETIPQSNIKESSSKGKSLQNTSSTRVSDPTHVSDPSQASNPTRQEEQMVVQMDTDDADKQQELGASSGQGKNSMHGENARSENNDLQTRESVEFRGEVRGG